MGAAGRLDQRIDIQQKSVTRAANGEEVVTWVSFASNLAAEVQQLRGREFYAAAQMQATVDHKLRIRYLAGVTRDMRITWRGQTLDIIGIAEIERRRMLEILCVAGVRNG